MEINLAVYNQKTLISKLTSYVKKDISYLDIFVVREIITWKWQNHVKSKYIKEFWLMLGFALCYLSSMFM